MLTVPFHVKLFDGLMTGLQATDNPLLATNFSTAFRELSRNVLAHLAPLEDIKACSWYEPDDSAKGGVTRRHRAQYVIHGGLAPDFASDQLGIDVNGECRSLTASLDELSKFVHVNEETFDLGANAVRELAQRALQSFVSFLSGADECRQRLSDSITSGVRKALLAEVLRETIDDIDILATHHTVNSVSLHDVEVESVGSQVITFAVYAGVEVDLQWGSNSDVRRGDGAVSSESFPLECRFTSDVEAPTDLELVAGSLRIDTDSWYGVGDEESGLGT